MGPREEGLDLFLDLGLALSPCWLQPLMNSS